MSSGTTIPLLLLMFGMIITKPAEERAWRAGRISDRVAGWLIVLRLPILALGFALITGRDPVVVAVMTGVGLVLAFVLAPVAVGRLHAVRARGGGGPP